MFDKEILKIDYGVSYGSVTLKSLQNDNIPELDLLVREAIQNSSDASLSLEGNKFFHVAFNTGKFNPSEFNSYISDLSSYLDERFPEESADYLEIRDCFTSGLTGTIRKNDINKEDHGNFFKLIYDTGKRQTQSGAGGNWGFGKSVYYRVGIGLVAFYSRIKTEESYESRLIVTLVEDESKKNSDGSDATILNRFEQLSAGKAWWGIRDGKDLLPITDDEFIAPFLKTFGVSPFTGNQTGTSVIIPYIDPKRLLDDVIPGDADIESGVRDHFVEVWASRLEDYLRLSIQRWYAPKVHNRKLNDFSDKKYLIASVNQVPIRREDMLPFFRLVQELYTVALAKTYGCDYQSEWLRNIKCLPVNISKYFEGGSTSGYVAAVKITKHEFCGQANVLSPYIYIGKFEVEGGLNEPIVMYSRDPGMVIDYSVTGPWVKNVASPESEDEYVFAFYMPDTTKKLKSDLQVPEYAGINLGEYLRACEASDHMGWDDPSRMQLVTRIQKNTVNQINSRLIAGTEERIEATASRLSVRLGRALLPRLGYGKKKVTQGEGGTGGGGGTKAKAIDFTIDEGTLSTNYLEIPFTLKLNYGKKDAAIEILVASEVGWITPTVWKNDIGTLFPAKIESVYVKSITTNIDTKPIVIDQMCNFDKPKFSTEAISVELLEVQENGGYETAKLHLNLLNACVSGRIRISAQDKKYRYSFKAE